MEWLDVKMDLDCIYQVEIKRCIQESGESKYHLVCFCDASTVAYASAVYLIQCSGTTTSGNLVFSKASSTYQGINNSEIRVNGSSNWS